METTTDVETYFLVKVTTEKPEQAAQVINERLHHEEEIGFNYTIEALDNASVHVIDVDGRVDGFYVFADLDDARAFEATVNGDRDTSLGSACYRTEEVVCDHADALKLIASECEASEEAIVASLESGVPVATRAWAKGEGAPYSDKLEAVEYTYYPHAVDPDEGPGLARQTTLWVGLHPEMGCVNVDAGRERLEDEGWEVTDWGAA